MGKGQKELIRRVEAMESSQSTKAAVSSVTQLLEVARQMNRDTQATWIKIEADHQAHLLSIMKLMIDLIRSQQRELLQELRRISQGRPSPPSQQREGETANPFPAPHPFLNSPRGNLAKDYRKAVVHFSREGRNGNKADCIVTLVGRGKPGLGAQYLGQAQRLHGATWAILKSNCVSLPGYHAARFRVILKAKVAEFVCRETGNYLGQLPLVCTGR